MIVWLVSAALAADAAALRQLDGNGAVVDVSTEAIGVAVGIGPAGPGGNAGPVAVGVDYATGATVAAHTGMRRVLVGPGRAWGIDGIGTVGLAALLATPGVALVATGELRAGLRNERAQATLGLLVPLAVRLDLPPQVAAPLGLELRLAARLGPVWVGCRGQAGGTLVIGGTPAGRASAGGFVEVRR